MKAKLPLFIFVGLLLLLAVGLTLNPRSLPSPLLGKPAPALTAPLLQGEGGFDASRLQGKVWLLNVWASWCGTCKQEHAALLQLQSALGEQTPIVGLVLRDEAEEAKTLLRKQGNPYTVILFDSDGKQAMHWGTVAIPETFVIDKQGVVQHKVSGAITDSMINKELLPLIQRLEQMP